MAKKQPKIVYTLTDEHRAQLEPWARRWIANAMSTKAMDEADRVAMRVAIKGMYEAAKLEPPPDSRIVFVPSPLVGNIAAGFAAGVWWLRKNNKEARIATRAATDAATRDATRDATYAATDAATDAATHAATNWAFRLASQFGPRKFMAECARNAWKFKNGGNHWSGWCAYLSFFRHVAKLPIDYSRWQHYEAAAIHGSWRWMHEEFCIVSDRPKTLKVDHLNRPHCGDGPSHEWRDGWKLYHWKGLNVTSSLIEDRHTTTPSDIMEISNAELRRAAIEIYAATHGPARFVNDLGAIVLSEDMEHGRPRRIYGVGEQRFLHVVNGSLEPDGSRREFMLGADPSAATPHDAVAASYGRPARKYREAVRT